MIARINTVYVKKVKFNYDVSYESNSEPCKASFRKYDNSFSPNPTSDSWGDWVTNNTKTCFTQYNAGFDMGLLLMKSKFGKCLSVTYPSIQF